ncbi:periplasmic heavy metal sensor [Rhodovulum sp. 12E13]|uniref:periplasmic heavy metal sensor n=1 Tax=Rhodovulum sp. 12E13 TaxID=2203891 RepID=UPI001313FA7D|nr:periplasmic heavy metal sensor [Rhodovulum sp. 12E13]
MSEAPPPDRPGPAGPVAGPRGSRVWLKVALFVSLGLNLLVAGFVAGAVLGRDTHVRPVAADMARDLGLAPYVGALSPADRRAIARDVRSALRAQGGRRALRSEARASFAAVLAALRAEPFDRAALERLLAGQVARAEMRRSLGQAALLDRLEEMSPEARAAFADRLDAGLRRPSPADARVEGGRNGEVRDGEGRDGGMPR